MQYIKYNDLDKTQKKLVDESHKVLENAYSPYSKFCVGCSILTKNDIIISGTNIENSAYGSTLCAEKAAISKANSEGLREFKKIAVTGKSLVIDVNEMVAPCGDCRQIIKEFSHISDTNIEIIMSDSKKENIRISTIDELLPVAFGPKDIGIDLNEYKLNN